MLARAARLPGRAVAVYGSEEPPKDSTPLADVDRCIARAAYRLAMDVQLPRCSMAVARRRGYAEADRPGVGWPGQRPC